MPDSDVEIYQSEVQQMYHHYYHLLLNIFQNVQGQKMFQINICFCFVKCLQEHFLCTKCRAVSRQLSVHYFDTEENLMILR